MKKPARKKTAANSRRNRAKRYRRNPAKVNPADIPDFLKTLVSAFVKAPAVDFRIYTYAQMLEMSTGFANALMSMTSEELNEFERERIKLVSNEIMELGTKKYEIPGYDFGVTLFNMGMEIMTLYNEQFQKRLEEDGGGCGGAAI